MANAILASAASISNAGPLYEIARVNELKGVLPIAEMTPTAYGVMTFGMILGRLEVVAILSVFTLGLLAQLTEHVSERAQTRCTDIQEEIDSSVQCRFRQCAGCSRGRLSGGTLRLGPATKSAAMAYRRFLGLCKFVI